MRPMVADRPALVPASTRAPAASSHLEAGGFIRSRRASSIRTSSSISCRRRSTIMGARTARIHAYQVHVGTMRPASARLDQAEIGRSAPASAHRSPSTCAEEHDRREFRACVRLTPRDLRAERRSTAIAGRRSSPAPMSQPMREIDAFIRRRADSAYHPSCTCKMGTDEMAVVDPQCRVHGLDGLRVVDAVDHASIVSGNLNAPTIMMAEKAADMILGRAPPALPRAAVWLRGARLAHPAAQLGRSPRPTSTCTRAGRATYRRQHPSRNGMKEARHDQQDPHGAGRWRVADDRRRRGGRSRQLHGRSRFSDVGWTDITATTGARLGRCSRDWATRPSVDLLAVPVTYQSLARTATSTSSSATGCRRWRTTSRPIARQTAASNGARPTW